LISQKNNTLKINFAENFEVRNEVKNEDAAFVSEVKYADDKVQQTLTFSNDFRGFFAVRFPDWASFVTLEIGNKPLETETIDGFVTTKSSIQISPKDKMIVAYDAAKFAEDRRFRKINLNDIPKDTSKQVIFRRGQFVLAATGINQIPKESGINPIPKESRQWLPINRWGTENETIVFVFEELNGEIKLPDSGFRLLNQ
jgi:DUF1680 family protein